MLGSANLRSVCRQVGYMAHPSLLYDEMSGMENLRYFARLYDIEDDKLCASVISAVRRSHSNWSNGATAGSLKTRAKRSPRFFFAVV